MAEDRESLEQALRLMYRALVLVEEAGEKAAFHDLQDAVTSLEYLLARSRPDEPDA